MYSLPGKELVRMIRLTQTIKKQWEVMMIVQLLYLHLQGEEGGTVKVGGTVRGARGGG